MSSTITFSVEIKSSGGMSSIAYSSQNYVRVANFICCRDLRLFGLDVISLSISPQNMQSVDGTTVTTRLDFRVNLDSSLTNKEIESFARKTERYTTLLLTSSDVNPQSGFSYAEVDWLHFNPREMNSPSLQDVLIIMSSAMTKKRVSFLGGTPMIDLTTPIIPYVGTGIFKLDSSYDEVKSLLQEQKIPYEEEIWKKTGEFFPWTVLVICKEGSKPQHSAVELCFAKNRLFKICLCEDFEGSLPNGIHTGMKFNDALKIDTNLEQDEGWDEVFISPDGYMVEYSNRNLAIVIITVLIPAFEQYDFFEYKW